MIIDLHKWTSADREALMALCNAVDRTCLSDRLLEKNGFLLEETKAGAVVKGGMAMDVRVYRLASDQASLHDF